MEQTSEQLPFDRLQPQDDDDRNRRSLFYCHCLHLYTKRLLDLMVNRADAGEFGEPVATSVPLLADWQLESASKILTCINLHLAGLDHGGSDSPAWLLYFFSEAMTEADELFPEPSAMEIIAKHGSWKREKMIRDVATHVREVLGFTDDVEKLQHELEANLQASNTYTAELLLFALSQPPDALRRHLEMSGG
jgi:hypothetical protein